MSTYANPFGYPSPRLQQGYQDTGTDSTAPPPNNTYVDPNAPPNNTGAPPGFDPSFYYNQNPLAGYYHWLYTLNPGLIGTGPQARFAQNAFGRYQSQYAADAAQDPMLQWYDWLQKKNINPQNEFQAQSPEERGDFTSRTLAPRARWAGY